MLASTKSASAMVSAKGERPKKTIRNRTVKTSRPTVNLLGRFIYWLSLVALCPLLNRSRNQVIIRVSNDADAREFAGGQLVAANINASIDVRRVGFAARDHVFAFEGSV